MTSEEFNYLQQKFRDLLSYGSDDMFEIIDPLTYMTPEGDSCLHIAAQRGDSTALEILIRAGMDIDSRGDMGATPLHYAYLGRQEKAIQLLLKAGADTNVRDDFGRLASETMTR